MAYIAETTISVHGEMAVIQRSTEHGPGIPTVADLRDALTALIEANPRLDSALVRAVDPDAATVTLYGAFHVTDAPSPAEDEGDDQ